MFYCVYLYAYITMLLCFRYCIDTILQKIEVRIFFPGKKDMSGWWCICAHQQVGVTFSVISMGNTCLRNVPSQVTIVMVFSA